MILVGAALGVGLLGAPLVVGAGFAPQAVTAARRRATDPLPDAAESFNPLNPYSSGRGNRESCLDTGGAAPADGFRNVRGVIGGAFRWRAEDHGNVFGANFEVGAKGRGH